MLSRFLISLFYFGFFSGHLEADDAKQGFQKVAEMYQLNKEEYLALFNQGFNEHFFPYELAVITIPKSGTHLVVKAVSLMTGKTPRSGENIDMYHFRWAHFWSHEEVKEFQAKKTLRLITLCRDPATSRCQRFIIFQHYQCQLDKLT